METSGRLTIRNFKKIQSLAYYADGEWAPLTDSSTRSGALWCIDAVKEWESHYEFRVAIIASQPHSFMVELCRTEWCANGKAWILRMKDSGREEETLMRRTELSMANVLDMVKDYIVLGRNV